MAGDARAADPAAHYYVPGVPLDKPELVAADPRAGAAQRLGRVRGARGRTRGRRQQGRASPRCSRRSGASEYDDERDARFINDRVHANIQNDGTFCVVPRIYGGVTSAASCAASPTWPTSTQVPMVKITGGQRIDLLGIRKEDLPDVWRDLGMPSGHAYTKAFRTCKTCVGTEFCRYGVGDSTALGIAIEKRFQGLESPHKMKLAVNGCPRNCSEATTKDLGAVAIEGGRWEVYVGGAAGARVRKGDLLCVVDTHDDVLALHGPLHAVLPRERQVPGAHLRLRRARRHRASCAASWSTTPRASPRGSTPRSRPRSTPTAIPGRKRTQPVHPAQFRRRSLTVGRSWRCRCMPHDQAGTDRPHPARRRPRLPRRRRDVAVFRTRTGALFGAAGDLSAPRGPLADGIMGGGHVVCPLHSLAFDLTDGRCVSAAACGDLRTYPVTVGPDGQVPDRASRPGRSTEAA